MVQRQAAFNLGALSEENWIRVQEQNEKPISVIIGNPPYNANQQNENDNNKNREYPEIDHRIRETYVKKSAAQKTKQYDMYKRFLRWAADRLYDDGDYRLRQQQRIPGIPSGRRLSQGRLR